MHAWDLQKERQSIILITEILEFEVKKQKVKIKEDDKIKTIFKISPIFLTVVKKETTDYILVLTLWESSEEEEKIWKTK